MENNTQPSVNTPTPPQIPVEPSVSPNKSNLLVVSLVIIEVVTLLIAGYFAYQFAQLRKQLVTQPTPTPISNSTLPTISPVASGLFSPAPDETANWKTYVSKFQSFSFKIPKQLVVSETKDSVEVFLNQEALDKSKVCKPDPKDIEPLPCSPFLLSIFYAEAPKSNYKSGEDYVNQVRGGMGGNPPYQTVQGQGLGWTAGQSAGIELRPTVRAFAYDLDKIRFIETNTYVLPFWEYTHNSSSSNNDWSTASAQTDWTKLQNFSYQILSTLKFTQ